MRGVGRDEDHDVGVRCREAGKRVVTNCQTEQ
jgi:hypothetical protein